MWKQPVERDQHWARPSVVALFAAMKPYHVWTQRSSITRAWQTELFVTSQTDRVIDGIPVCKTRSLALVNGETPMLSEMSALMLVPMTPEIGTTLAALALELTSELEHELSGVRNALLALEEALS